MRAIRDWFWVIFPPMVFLFSDSSRAQWTSVSIPKSLQGATILTTSPVNARCHSVRVDEGARSCSDSTATPSFHVSDSDREVLETLPAGSTLTLLEAQRDPDGFAVRVQDQNGSIFWIFESNSRSSSEVNSGSLNQLLNEVAVAGAVTALQSTAVASTTPSVAPPCNCETPEMAQTHAPQVPVFGAMTDSGEGFHNRCSSFISETGEYGPHGNFLAREMSAPHRAGLFSNEIAARVNEMPELCPNFFSFTDAQKERFWVWTFMSIAHVESKCGVYNEGKVPGPSGVPWGLLQMEWVGVGIDGARSRWAENPSPETACRAPDISLDQPNLACGLDAMLSYITGYHICDRTEYRDRAPVLTDPDSCRVPISGIYWQKMRTLNGDISRRIQSFEACGANP